VTDTATRLAGLSDERLMSLHKAADKKAPVDAAQIEAHHLIATELLKRGLEHGHNDDSWASAVIIKDTVGISSPEEIDAPEGMEKAWAETLKDGGTVSILLTVDGYVLKADPTVSDVHVDAVMGGRRRRPLDKAEWKEGDFAVWGSSGGSARGQIEHIMREGVLGIPDSDFSIEATEDDPAVLLRIFRKGPKGWAATETLVGHKMSALNPIEDLIKEAGYQVPEGVQSAAKTALKWIADGQSGDGFTSVGRNRADQLASGGTVSRATLVKMRAYFARHFVDKEAEGWGDRTDPTPGMVAWYAWGGDAGRTWANTILGKVEKRAIPEAITDLHINIENRQHAIDEYLYGPMNPEEPGDYWERLGAVWDVSAEEAFTTHCGNCSAFNITPEIRTAIADAIGEGGEEVVTSADLGYCELFQFKCAAARSCSAWLVGGPIGLSDEEEDGEIELLASMDQQDLTDFASYAYLADENSIDKAGNPESLRDYWRGGGKGKVSWGAGGDFTSCVAAVGKYMSSEQAKGYCAIRHREVTGMWPGDKRNRMKKESTVVLKHPGHSDQKVHGGHGGGAGTDLSPEGKTLIKQNLSRGNLVESYGASYDHGKAAKAFGQDHVDRKVSESVGKRDALISQHAGKTRSHATEGAAFSVASHQGFIDGAMGRKAQFARSHNFGETVAGFFGAGLSGATKAREPFEKHPGHSDQSVHGRKGGGSASAGAKAPAKVEPKTGVKRPGMGDGTKVSDEDFAKLKDGSAGAHIIGRDKNGAPIFTPERQALHDKIVLDSVTGVPTSKDLTYSMLGGGPAAGKSSMESKVIGDYRGKAVAVNSDNVKVQLPEFQAKIDSGTTGSEAAAFVHEESSYVAKRVQQAAFERRQDVVLDGTGDSSAEGLQGKIDKAHKLGYTVNGYYATLPTETAVRLAKQREAETGRGVPEHTIRGTHKSVSQVFPTAVKGMDKIQLFDTSDFSAGPKLIAEGSKGRLIIRDADAYESFLNKGNE